MAFWYIFFIISSDVREAYSGWITLFFGRFLLLAGSPVFIGLFLSLCFLYYAVICSLSSCLLKLQCITALQKGDNLI